MNTGQLTQPFRSLGLMHVLDIIKFQFQRIKYHGRNRQFKLKYPRIVMPPDYMLFESFKLDYDKYFNNGLDYASSLIDIWSPHIFLNKKNILDWGCGPARIARHLPSLLPTCDIFATDYNEKTIRWCKGNIPSVHFTMNNINPPTNYENEFFDVIYGISIFTHLSEPNHQGWYEELVRIVAPGGILFLTTQGNAFKEILTTQEQEDFTSGKLVVRGKAKEGHRVFSAFQPSEYMTSLFEQHCTILEHQPGVKKEWGIEQDSWLLKKN
jgi:2-polyprenyl-3-methyl-5-hydroxy-6-metoxy-1,4-benzoquinol methylase